MSTFYLLMNNSAQIKKKWEWKYENDEFFRRDMILFYQKTFFEWDKITEINN